jgi:alkanesulfonate monooxygenase SsuD/methylene tetrahydromethanopterin reductase-like flavin-dependent oxidoreductase (luciferase family)
MGLVPDGRPMLGISLVPEISTWHRLAALTKLADESGLDLIGIQDHPYQWRFADTFTLIAALLARTSRIRIFPDVANLPLRPPAMLAKTASTLDVLSGGRFELGIGAGSFWDAIEAMGGPRRTPSEAVDALAEAIEVIRLMWSGERSINYPGRHYQVRGVHPGEAPPHPIQIWVGAYGPRLLGLVGRVANGWVPSFGRVTRDQLRSGQEIVDEAAVASGRDPGSVRRVLNLGGVIAGPGPGDRREPTTSVDQISGGLAGPPDFWHDRIRELQQLGFDGFVFWPAEPSEEQVARLANEVAPLIRAPG